MKGILGIIALIIVVFVLLIALTISFVSSLLGPFTDENYNEFDEFYYHPDNEI